jgi:hypothetical protein
MAKKNKRPASTTTFAKAAPQHVEFNPDYTIIKRDLKRIAMLAASFVVVLIALSFIIK